MIYKIDGFTNKHYIQIKKKNNHYILQLDKINSLRINNLSYPYLFT